LDTNYYTGVRIREKCAGMYGFVKIAAKTMSLEGNKSHQEKPPSPIRTRRETPQMHADAIPMKRKARRQCNRQDGYQGFGQLIQNQEKTDEAVNQKPTSKAVAERANALEGEKKEDQSNNSSKPRTWQSRSRLVKKESQKKISWRRKKTCRIRRCVQTIQRNAEREIEYIRIGGDQGPMRIGAHGDPTTCRWHTKEGCGGERGLREHRLTPSSTGFIVRIPKTVGDDPLTWKIKGSQDK
jgi:hypothetical protein